MTLSIKTQHNETQHNDTQHNQLICDIVIQTHLHCGKNHATLVRYEEQKSIEHF